MAGAKLNQRIISSSILEVIIAMVLIVVVFGVAMMIFTNIMRFSLSGKQLRAQAILEESLINIENGDSITNQAAIQDIEIRKEYKVYNRDKNLQEIDLIAYDQNQVKLAEVKKIIAKKTKNE